jgi:hypothetical protein
MLKYDVGHGHEIAVRRDNWSDEENNREGRNADLTFGTHRKSKQNRRRRQ